MAGELPIVVSDDEGLTLDDSIVDALSEALEASEAEMLQTTTEPIPIGDMSTYAPYGRVGARGRDPSSPQLFSIDKEAAIEVEDSMEGILYTPEYSSTSKDEDMRPPVSKAKIKRDEDEAKPLPSSTLVEGTERSVPTDATEIGEDLFSESPVKKKMKSDVQKMEEILRYEENRLMTLAESKLTAQRERFQRAAEEYEMQARDVRSVEMADYKNKSER